MRLSDKSYFYNRKSYYFACAGELLSPLLNISSRVYCSRKPSSAQSWRRGLILGDSHLGDLLYRTASIDRLKASLPQCKFYYLATRNTSAVLDNNPVISRILPWQDGDDVSEIDFRAFTILRDINFDVAFCTNIVRGWSAALLALRLGIPNRVGYGSRGFSGLLTHRIFPSHPQPLPGYFRDFVAQLTNNRPDWPLAPKVFIDSKAESDAERTWTAIGVSPGRSVIACFPIGRQPHGKWPLSWFGEVLKKVEVAGNYQTLIFGAASDKDELINLKNRHQLNAPIVAGDVELKLLPALLKNSAAILTQDSGPRHIGNSIGIPVLFLRNTWFNRFQAGTYCDNEIDLVPGNLSRLTTISEESAFQYVPTDSALEILIDSIKKS